MVQDLEARMDIHEMPISAYNHFVTEMYDEEMNDIDDDHIDKFYHNKYQNRMSKIQIKLYRLWEKTGTFVYCAECKRMSRKYKSVGCQTEPGRFTLKR